jgi:large subunit ribosomal protein L24
MKIKKGDEVKIIRGKDKGKTVKVEKVFTKSNSILIPGVNLFKRHMKSRFQNRPSEIIEVTKPLFAYNVALICPNCHKETRVGYKVEGKDKIRICRKCGKKI